MIRANSNETLQVDTGSLYPALHRLERKKWIAADWDVSENRQRVRVYSSPPPAASSSPSSARSGSSSPQAIAGVMRPPAPEGET